MYCTDLTLTNFRNYKQLNLELPPGLTLLYGNNASGKTSLLEAIYFLATARSPRAANDVELVNAAAGWQLGTPPFARITADIARQRGEVTLDVTLIRDRASKDNLTPLSSEQPGEENNLTRKRIKINGSSRRAVDLVGQINVVLFSPQDIDLVAGSPSLRRRYLDITISQVDHRYMRALQEYNKIVLQRNSLLRRLKERDNQAALVAGDQMNFWNEAMSKQGSYIMLRRLETLEQLGQISALIHPRLSNPDERLNLHYIATFPLPAASQLVEKILLAPHEEQGAKEKRRQTFLQTIEERFIAEQTRLFSREVARGISLIGPHRDDFTYEINDIEMATFGSRGQQRTIALALKLSEVEFMRKDTGEIPILLLDDITSELDPARREFVLRTISEHEQQIILTGTDLGAFDTSIRQRAAKTIKVEKGEISAG